MLFVVLFCSSYTSSVYIWIVHANALPICVQMSSDSDSDDETEMIVRHHAHALNVIYILVSPILLLSTATHIWIRQTQEPLFSVEWVG